MVQYPKPLSWGSAWNTSSAFTKATICGSVVTWSHSSSSPIATTGIERSGGWTKEGCAGTVSGDTAPVERG